MTDTKQKSKRSEVGTPASNALQNVPDRLGFQIGPYDDDFDFVKGQLSGALESYFGDQLQRARTVLQHRSRDEIIYALESLDWMLRNGGKLLYQNAIENMPNPGDGNFVSRVKALKLWSHDYDLSDQSQLPDATWADYFAVLALAYIAETSYSENLPETTAGPFQETEALRTNIQLSRLHEWAEQAIECMDAVCYAERIQNELKLAETGPSAEVMRARGAKGGKIRVSKFDALRARVIALYEEKHSERSNRNAAKRIYDEIKGEVDAILKTDDPEKRLEIWIGQYKRSKQATPSS